MSQWGSESGDNSNSVINKIKRKIAARKSLSPALMASPPRIVVQAANIGPTNWVNDSAGADALQNSQQFKLFTSLSPITANPAFTISALNSYNASFADGNGFNNAGCTGLISPGGASLGVIRFCSDAQYIGIGTAAGASLSVLCDGETVSPVAINNGGSGGNGYYITLKHQVRKAREYTILTNGCFFGGVTVGQRDSVWPVKNRDLRVFGDGDSYMQGKSGLVSSGILAASAIALDADWECHGMGGTGWVAVNGAYPNLLTRLPSAIAANNGASDIVMIAMGVNDASNVLANATAYLTQLRTALPNALFVIVGVWTPDTGNISRYTSRNSEIKAATIAAGGLYVFIDTIAGTWQSSWGVSESTGGAQWLSGNASASVTSQSITSASRASNVVTLTTSVALSAIAGDNLLVTNCGEFSGLFTIASITGTTITHNQYGANTSLAAPYVTNAVAYKMTVGSGNMAQYCVGYDLTHLSELGQEYLSERVWSVLSQAVASY